MLHWAKRHARLLSGLGLLLAAGLVAAAVRFMSADSLETTDKVVGIASATLGTILTALSIWINRRNAPTADADSWMQPAAEDLAVQVRRQWQAEQHVRGLDETNALQTRWHSAPQDIAAPAAEVLAGRSPGRPTALHASGTISSVADDFHELPHAKLVIIGRPGAGKTVLALTLVLQLLARQKPGEPAPVFLPISTWNPQQNLESWLCQRLAEEYPRVGPLPHGALVSYRKMLRKGRILPVLDGFDELPPSLHEVALKALNLFAAHSRGLVVTCRYDEYEALVNRTGRPVPRAAVVEILPLTPEVAASYLSGDRWRAVRQALTAEQEERRSSVLLDAFQTPLTLHLARTAYAPRGTDPAELLDVSCFPTCECIQDHLLRSYLSALYSPDFSGLMSQSGRRPLRQDMETAKARLRYLAQSAGESFSWWNLHEVVRNWPLRSPAVVGICAVLTVGLLSTLLPRPIRLTEIGLGDLLPLALALGFVSSPLPSPGPNQEPRQRLARSIFSTAWPAFYAIFAIYGLRAFLSSTYTGSSAARVLYMVLDAALLGLEFAVGYELGRSMRDLTGAVYGKRWEVVRRAGVTLVAFGVLLYANNVEDNVRRGSLVAAIEQWQQVATMCAIALGAFVIHAFLPDGSTSMGGWTGGIHGVKKIVRVGAPVAVTVGACIALNEARDEGPLDVYFVGLAVVLVALSVGLVMGCVAQPDVAASAVPATTPWQVQTVVRAGLAGVLVFTVVSAVFTVGIVASDVPSGAPRTSVTEAAEEALPVGAIGGLIAGLLALGSSILPTRAHDLDRTEPHRALRRDRGAVVAILCGAVVLDNLWEGGDFVPLGGAILCVLLLASASRWPAYMGARMLLYSDGKMPWRVMRFLRDAHERGVLRRVGSAYQFRHALIRQSLARQ